MSYINTQSTALVKVKLTDVGRQKIATGSLSFDNYIIGDSEVDYNYVKGWREFVPNSGAATGEFFFPEADGNIIRDIYSKVLRPKDDQPYLTSFLLDQNNTFTFPLNQQGNVQLIKGIVSNEAAERGFFSGSSAIVGLTAATSSNFIKESGTIDLLAFSGGTDFTTYLQGVLTLDTPLSATSANDYIMFRFSNPTLGNITGDSMTQANLNSFYNIVSISGSSINVDRPLPILDSFSGTIITYYTFPGGDDPMDTYYGSSSLSAYWNTGTLSFDSSCDVCIENIPVWNMNNVWSSENLAGQFNDGVTDYHGNTLFGSEQYAGSKQFLGANYTPVNTSSSSISYIDKYQKGISIIHYTNSCISNFYGEMFHIEPNADNKFLTIDVPILWHHRDSATASGTTSGMRFVSDTIEQNLGVAGNNTIKYVDLIEFSGLSKTPNSPMKVGKVFPQLKILVIENEELLAAMSYKSNRNYTLPDLSASLIAPCEGPCTGVIPAGETLFLTYWLENTGTTTTPTLPCQRYTVIKNNEPTDMDVEFRLSNVGELPYMRKTELPTYDGLGFFADRFNLLSQVIDTTIQPRPLSSQWRLLTGFTSTNITGVITGTTVVPSGVTINPTLLERQTPLSNGFILTGELYTGATIFNLGDELEMSSGSFYGQMTFGDERLFYGNLNTFIGATVYKTLFNISVDGATMSSSSNPTYNNGDRFITEIGILSGSDLVLVGKLSRPIKLSDQGTASIELTIDF